MRLLSFGRDEHGGSVVEFALVLPIFLMLLLGTIHAALLMFAVSSLHYAVEEAARCSAVNAVDCATSVATAAFAEAQYRGPDVDAQFVAADAACGREVRVTGSFVLHAGVGHWNVPVAARACFAAPEPVAA